MSFRNSRGYRAYSHLCNQLYGNTRPRIHIFQIENQLGQILNRINIVMRRRRNQSYSGDRVADPGNHVVHFMARQLSAFSRLCTLRDLDLQIVRINHVVGGNAEAGRGHLLNRAAAQIAVGVGNVAGFILSAFSGV